jgi:hypothetical protein
MRAASEGKIRRKKFGFSKSASPSADDWAEFGINPLGSVWAACM